MPPAQPEPAMADVPLDWLEAAAAFLWPEGGSAIERYWNRSASLHETYRIEVADGRPMPMDPDGILAELGRRRFGQDRPGTPFAAVRGKRPKRWRLFGIAAEPEDFTGFGPARDATRSLADAGCPFTIYHWQDDAWHIYEHHEPAKS